MVASQPHLRNIWKTRIKILSAINDIELTLDLLSIFEENKHFNDYSIITESDVLSGEVSVGLIDSSLEEKYENVTDIGGLEVDNEQSGSSQNTSQGQREILSLSSFLRRPIPIANFQIPLSSDVSVIYDIWDLYTINPTMRAKLRNYAYLRGNLNVRIAVSGTPFHYGRLLVSYQPYNDRNQNLISHAAALSADPGWRPLLLNYLSQSPGAATIDVRENKPLDIVCPFISTKPMHRLYNSATTAISSATSFDDLAEAGSIYLYSLNQVKSTSDTPSEVSVYIYAWMTDVELGTSTATQVGIVTESKILKDERDVGPVEKISSQMAEVSGVLSQVPVIAPFAKASQIALQGISKISSIFGWSKPIMLSPPNLVKNVGFQNGAHTIGYDTNYRITLDPKQELSVDPRIAGNGEDEMSIAYIAQRESYLTTFSWNDNSTVMASPLWTSAVVPHLHTSEFFPVSGKYGLQPTALAFSAAPFYYWRGDIEFRFDIVASNFHRGKLAFFYEPNVAQNVLINADIDTNKQFMKIIDIQETQSISFCVKWAYPRAWALAPDFDDLPLIHGPSASLASFIASANGYIGVVPLTTLQSPDDSDISINVYVKSSNIEYNLFCDDNVPTRREIVTESEVISQHAVTCYDLNESTADSTQIAQEHFGERPVSFRSLCKRYVATTSQGAAASVLTEKTILSTFNNIPVPSPIYGGTTSLVSMIGYLRYAYLGVRGGMRKRIHHFINHQAVDLAQARVSLDSPAIVVIPSTSYNVNPHYSKSIGTVTFVLGSSSGIEVEVPFYSNNLFAFSFADLLIGSNADNDMIVKWSKSYTVAVDSFAANNAGFVVEETASGEDFTFFRFQGAPFFSTA
jgi:hypothetical protein